MPNYSKKIVYLSNAQYQELVTNQSITVDGNTITYNENDIYVTPQTAPVTDVQVNGSSILSQGVANIPYAGTQNVGVVRTEGGYGLLTYSGNGRIYTDKAPTDAIKQGTNYFKPIVPYNQHESVYYALAKAAGADMASVTGETVGVYPEAQKKAICKMIGVPYLHGEKIAEYTTTEDLESVTINTDLASQAFELCKAKVIVVVPAMSAKSNFFADALTINELNGNDDTYRLPTMQAAAEGRTLFYEIETYGGYVTYSRAYNGTGFGTTLTGNYTFVADKSPKCITGFKLSQYTGGSLIPTGTRIALFGVRL